MAVSLRLKPSFAIMAPLVKVSNLGTQYVVFSMKSKSDEQQDSVQ
jgi:hypothetical protein